jgi:hypothetical protein
MNIKVFKLCVHVHLLISILYNIAHNYSLYRIIVYELISSPVVNKWQ